MKNTTFKDRQLLPTVKFGSVSIMGGVAIEVTGNLVKVEGCMYSSQFQQIFVNNVHKSMTKFKLNRGWILQQDNTLFVNPINLISLF